MRIISAKQAKQIDLKATQELGLSTLIMMENAGIRIADFVSALLKRRNKKNVAVFCGKGNNAGDGLVVSRQLLCRGINADTFLLVPAHRLSSIARRNLKILKGITGNIRRIKSLRDLEKINFSSYAILIDAIFGIGIRGRVEGMFYELIRQLNASRSTIVSVDIPSGLDADKGRALGIAVKADYTVTLIAAKRGLVINQGPEFGGRLIIRHIGFPFPRR